MQFKKIFTLLITLGLLLPGNKILAQSRHYSQPDLQQEIIFSSTDGQASLIIPAKKYSSLDAYFYTESLNFNSAFEPLTPIYSYYLYTDEVKAEDFFILNLKLDPKKTAGQAVYYWSNTANRYDLAEIISQTNESISFKLTGKENKFFLAQKSQITSNSLSLTASDLSVKTPELLKGQDVSISVQSSAQAENLSKKRISDVYQIDLILKNQSIADFLKQAQIKNICEPYLAGYISTYRTNSVTEVKKLQKFLREIGEFSSVQINGKYDKITREAVASFQEEYSKEILQPVGLTKGNGEIYKGTLAKINSLYCQINKDKKEQVELSLAYTRADGLAKTIYYWSEADANWLPLKSSDNYRAMTVTALTRATSLKVALVEEDNQWVGEASWYAYKNGDFAASRDFPKGTKLKVTNQKTGVDQGKSVIVTINDYGPEIQTNRIIDLDKIAFQKIGNLRDGVMPVKIEAITTN